MVLCASFKALLFLWFPFDLCSPPLEWVVLIIPILQVGKLRAEKEGLHDKLAILGSISSPRGHCPVSLIGAHMG